MYDGVRLPRIDEAKLGMTRKEALRGMEEAVFNKFSLHIKLSFKAFGPKVRGFRSKEERKVGDTTKGALPQWGVGIKQLPVSHDVLIEESERLASTIDNITADLDIRGRREDGDDERAAEVRFISGHRAYIVI